MTLTARKSEGAPSSADGRPFESVARGLQVFADWWLAEASNMVSGRVARWLVGAEQQWLGLGLQEGSDDVELQLITRSGRVVHMSRMTRNDYSAEAASAMLAKAGLDVSGIPIGLVVPDSMIFERAIEVPKEAIAKLQKIAIEEMIRRTPFKPDQVYVRQTVIPHPSDRNKRLVRQRIIRRDFVLDRCQALGLDLETVQIIATPKAMSANEVIGSADRPLQAASSWRPLLAVAAILCVGLAATNVGIVRWRQSAALAEINDQLPSARSKALVVRQMLDQITATQAAVRAMFYHKTQPSALQIWEETTRIVPDTSWLTEFSVQDGRLSVAGYSDNAAALVPFFAISRQLSNVALSSPIMAQGNIPVERFAITARISGEPTKPEDAK